MMPKDGDWILRGRSAMWISRGTECGLAERTSINKDAAPLIEAEIITGRYFHQEIVRMLAVHDRYDRDVPLGMNRFIVPFVQQALQECNIPRIAQPNGEDQGRDLIRMQEKMKE